MYEIFYFLTGFPTAVPFVCKYMYWKIFVKVYLLYLLNPAKEKSIGNLLFKTNSEIL